MLASAVNNALQSVPFPSPKPRLLLVSDSYDRLRSLESGFNHNEFDITSVCSLEELIIACCDRHDLAALDVSPSQIEPMLRHIRTSETHTAIPVLVEVTRLTNDLTLAGLLPEYRAMPCSHTDMITLLQRGAEQNNDDSRSRRVL